MTSPQIFALCIAVASLTTQYVFGAPFPIALVLLFVGLILTGKKDQ